MSGFYWEREASRTPEGAIVEIDTFKMNWNAKRPRFRAEVFHYSASRAGKTPGVPSENQEASGWATSLLEMMKD
jgi:hypothetical protein